MEQVLIIVAGAIITISSVVLGAILAISGGFLHQMYQNNLTQKRDDRELLFKAVDIDPMLFISSIVKEIRGW